MESSQSQAGLHITIGAAPLLGNVGSTVGHHSRLRLEYELLLVKAALLYGDQAKLYSPFASLVLGAMRFRDEPIRQQLRYLKEGAARSLAPGEEAFISDQEIEKYRSILRKSHPNNKQLQQKQQFESKLAQFQEMARQLANDAGADGVLDAIDSGLLQVHSFKPSLSEAMAKSSDTVDDFLHIMSEVVSDTSTYPLFDTDLGGWIRSEIEEGTISVGESTIRRGKQIGLAADLFERLPVFELATVQEILDIRRELEKPLVRFRTAIIGFAGEVKHEQWTEDFAFDAEQIYRREVAPAVLEIEEVIKTNSLLASLIRKPLDKPLVIPGGSGLAVALSKLQELPTALLTSITGLSTLGLLAYDAYKEWREQQKSIEQNQLYFYYAVRDRLGNLPRTWTP